MNPNTLFTPAEWQTLQAVAVRIVPATPGYAADGTVALPYLLRELKPGGAAGDFLPTLREWLRDAPPESQDGATFRRLAELITEGFYMSPTGMAMVGFQRIEELAF